MINICKIAAGLNTLFLFSVVLHAQGAGYHDKVLDFRGRPLAGRTVTVCSVTATVGLSGSCTPVVNTFTNVTLTAPAGGNTTVLTDRAGYFQFYLPPNNYCYTVTGVARLRIRGNTCYPFSIPVVPGSSLAFNAVTSCAMSGIYIAGSPCYSTVQLAITAACAAGGG